MKSYLKGTELFRDLTDAELDLLAPFVKSETFKRGEAIFRERDPAGKFYVVEAGVVELTRAGRADHRPARVSILERGDLFGELALADEGPRTASATATVTPETRLFSIEVPPLQAFLGEHPSIAYRVHRGLIRRVAARVRAATEALTCLLQTF